MVQGWTADGTSQETGLACITRFYSVRIFNSLIQSLQSLLRRKLLAYLRPYPQHKTERKVLTATKTNSYQKFHRNVLGRNVCSLGVVTGSVVCRWAKRSSYEFPADIDGALNQHLGHF